MHGNPGEFKNRGFLEGISNGNCLKFKLFSRKNGRQRGNVYTEWKLRAIEFSICSVPANSRRNRVKLVLHGNTTRKCRINFARAGLGFRGNHVSPVLFNGASGIQILFSRKRGLACKNCRPALPTKLSMKDRPQASFDIFITRVCSKSRSYSACVTGIAGTPFGPREIGKGIGEFGNV